MKTLIRFRLFAVRIALIITMIAVTAAWMGLGRVVGMSLAMGALAGIVVFWATARKLEKVALEQSNAVYSVPVAWRFAGLAVYVAVLIRGYTLDRDGFTGLIAAAAGLFIIRLAMVILGITGVDLPKEED